MKVHFECGIIFKKKLADKVIKREVKSQLPCSVPGCPSGPGKPTTPDSRIVYVYSYLSNWDGIYQIWTKKDNKCTWFPWKPSLALQTRVSSVAFQWFRHSSNYLLRNHMDTVMGWVEITEDLCFDLSGNSHLPVDHVDPYFLSHPKDLHLKRWCLKRLTKKVVYCFDHWQSTDRPSW